MPGALVLAGASRVWHGGMAFYDHAAPGPVAGCAYLVTTEQFADVAAREMRRPPGGKFAHDLTGLLPDVETMVATGRGLYETGWSGLASSTESRCSPSPTTTSGA